MRSPSIVRVPIYVSRWQLCPLFARRRKWSRWILSTVKTHRCTIRRMYQWKRTRAFTNAYLCTLMHAKHHPILSIQYITAVQHTRTHARTHTHTRARECANTCTRTRIQANTRVNIRTFFSCVRSVLITCVSFFDFAKSWSACKDFVTFFSNISTFFRALTTEPHLCRAGVYRNRTQAMYSSRPVERSRSTVDVVCACVNIM